MRGFIIAESRMKRTAQFEKNLKLEAHLEKLGALLHEAEDAAIKNFVEPAFPAVFIHGCARSGTTLMMQILANTSLFTYPSNLISRFYSAPYIGAHIQLLLTDPTMKFRNELREFTDNNTNYQSSLGKTEGVLAPNEFYYFWRRFFNYREIQCLDSNELKGVDSDKLLSELAAFESVLNKPLLMKGMMLNWNIGYLDSIMKKAVFVHIKRDTAYCAQSLLEARKKFYGDVETWYSFKPPEYRSLSKMSPVRQVVGQVVSTNMGIEEQFADVNNNRKLVVEYNQLCKSPEKIVDLLLEKLRLQGYEESIEKPMLTESRFACRDEHRIGKKEWEEIENACQFFE